MHKGEENDMMLYMVILIARSEIYLKTEIHLRSREILRNLQCGLAVIKKVALDICN